MVASVFANNSNLPQFLLHIYVVFSTLYNYFVWQYLIFYKILLILPQTISLFMDDRSVIAKNIKLLREANNFTQDNVATFLGTKRSAYANYESGLRDIPLSVMEKLSDLFGCELYDLYDENSEAVKRIITTSFRADDLTKEDIEQIANFKKLVKNYLIMEKLSGK